jgi:hypothetical protein
MTGIHVPAPTYSQPSGGAHHQSHYPPQQTVIYHQEPFPQTQPTYDNKYNSASPTVMPLPSLSPYVTNRIEAIRRISALQYPDGHWDAAPELASFAPQWGGLH